MNCAISRQRKETVRQATSIDASSNDSEGALRDRLGSSGPTPAESAIRNERVEQVRVALMRLDPDERAILVMRDVDGMEYVEMAQVLDVPLGTLKSRLFRARMALRAAIERLERGG
jgi:RNA polymerase sigma-70 factor (ECF subfamily)